MTIAIDYDSTFAAAPKFFQVVIRLALSHDHTVVIVTGRSDMGEFGAEVRRAIAAMPTELQIPIVFAGHQWKRHAAEAAGYKIDVWMDDSPEYIGPQSLILSQHKESAS